MALLVGCLAEGCSSDSSIPDRVSARDGGAASGSDAGGGGGDAGFVDPSGGRDDTGTSCFAACQNGAFVCQAKATGKTAVSSVVVTLDDVGCVGTLTKDDGASVAFRLDCVERKACYGGAVGGTPTTCVPATFSAFSFGYTPSEGPPLNLCTRE